MSQRPAPSFRTVAPPICGKCGGVRVASAPTPVFAPFTPSELRALTRQPAPVVESAIPPAPSLDARVLALRAQSATTPAVTVARGGNQSVPPPPPSLAAAVLDLHRRTAAGQR